MGRMIQGLAQINVELSSRCSKSCGFCGRRQWDKAHGTADYGNMDFELVRILAEEIPRGTTVATHWNGESMMHPFFGECIRLFKDRGCFVYTVTNGKHLAEKAAQIDGILDVVSVSIIENDKERERSEQYENIIKFLNLRVTEKPRIVLRYVGFVDDLRFDELGLPIVRRTLHRPEGSIGYRQEPPIPENHVCREMLYSLAVDWKGNVSPCVRFDPYGEMILGNLHDSSLETLWNSPKRLYYRQMHIDGNRSKLKYCGDKCSYWGVPTSD